MKAWEKLEDRDRRLHVMLHKIESHLFVIKEILETSQRKARI